MLDITLGFIGAGNMARSLIGGLIADGFAAQAIHVSDPDAQQLGNLRGLFPVHIHTGNALTLQAVDVLVLAVKPQALHAVAVELRDTVQARRPLITHAFK